MSVTDTKTLKIAQVTWQAGMRPWFVADLPGHDGLRKGNNPKSDWGYTDDSSRAIPLNRYWQRLLTARSREMGRTVNYYDFKG